MAKRNRLKNGKWDFLTRQIQVVFGFKYSSSADQ